MLVGVLQTAVWVLASCDAQQSGGIFCPVVNGFGICEEGGNIDVYGGFLGLTDIYMELVQ